MNAEKSSDFDDALGDFFEDGLKSAAKTIDAWVKANQRVPATYAEIDPHSLLIHPLDRFVDAYLREIKVDMPPIARRPIFQKARRYAFGSSLFSEPQTSPREIASGTQLDFFVLDILAASIALKTDKGSAEAPYFALGTNDLKPFHWTSSDGTRRVHVLPPMPVPEKPDEKRLPARATIHDKDILIYLGSLLVRHLDQSGEQRVPDEIHFTPHDFLKATGRGVGKRAYELMEAALERLQRTSVRIDDHLPDGRWNEKESFNLISRWHAKRDHKDERLSKISVVFSAPFASAIEQRHVITLHRDYFSLKPLAKAVYTVAAKHCGRQASFKISLENLKDKIGYRQPVYNFKAELAEISIALPGYWVTIEDGERVKDALVIFTNKKKPAEAVFVGRMMARRTTKKLTK